MQSPFLQAVEQAAREIAAQRRRLNEAMLGLSSSVAAFDPDKYLTDDGFVKDKADPEAQEAKPPPNAVPVVKKPTPIEPPPAPPKPMMSATERIKQEALDHMRRNPNRRYSVRELASALTEDPPLVREAMADLSRENDNVVFAEFEGRMTYRFNVVPKPPVATKPKPKPAKTKPGATQKTINTKFGEKTITIPPWWERPGVIEQEERFRKEFLHLRDKVDDKQGATAKEIADELGLPDRNLVNTDLRELSSRGLVMAPEGMRRRSKGQQIGRFSDAWVAKALAFVNRDGKPVVDTGPLHVEAPPTMPDAGKVPASGEPESQPESAKPGAPQAFPALSESDRKVRDAVMKVKEQVQFTPDSIATEAKVPRTAALVSLERLAERGIVIDDSPAPDYRIFRRAPKPTSPGKAAAMDAAARRTESTARGAAPVPGTGKGLTISDDEMRKVVQDAVKAGATPTLAPNGHIELSWKSASGATVRKQIAHTPGGNPRRQALSARARLREMGLQV